MQRDYHPKLSFIHSYNFGLNTTVQKMMNSFCVEEEKALLFIEIRIFYLPCGDW